MVRRTRKQKEPTERKLTRKERRALRRKRREEEPVQDPLERAFENVLLRERTVQPNAEGYHFVRPEWHRWVYGGGKKGR